MDGTVITKKGMQLLVKLIATKGVLEFTRVSVGTGVMQNGYDPASMTDLIQYKMDGMISECEADGDIAKITMQISSVGIETGFTMTEMGVFADDPDLGEILYAYLDMREDPQYIYAEGGTAQKFVEVTLDVAIEEATKVTTYINPKSMITRKEFEEVTGNVNVTEKGSLQNQIGRLEEKSESVQNQIDQIKNGDAPVIFEDYTSDELDIPDPEYAINQITSGKSSKLIQQYIKAALKGLLNLAQRALNIATGRNQARVFATVAALDAWLAVPDNVKQLNVGDNFYITATDVPDYWWDGIQKQKLETQKVDLTTYDQRITANASAISELNGNLSSHSHAWSSITGKPSTFKPSSHNHDSLYYSKTYIDNALFIVKPKKVMVHVSGVATRPYEGFGAYKYYGGTNSEPLMQKVDELIYNGHTILGGFIARGGLNDKGYAGNMVNMSAVMIQCSSYYDVPYEIMFFSDAYQTIHYDIVILYY